MHTKRNFISAAFLAASIISFPVMAQESVSAMKGPESKSSTNGLSIPEPIKKAVSLAGKVLRHVEAARTVARNVDPLAPGFAPKSVRPYVKGKRFSELLGRVSQDAKTNFEDCARAGGCP